MDIEADVGIVDVHTDNLERQVMPRQNARWPSRSAMLAHDAPCAAAGVTTVLDALCLGDLGFNEMRKQTFLDGVRDLDNLSHFRQAAQQLTHVVLPRLQRKSKIADSSAQAPIAARSFWTPRIFTSWPHLRSVVVTS